MGEGSGVALSCGVGCRCGLDPAWLWLWCRPAATTRIQPLAWEPLYAAGAAREMVKRQKKKKGKENIYLVTQNVTPIPLIRYVRESVEDPLPETPFKIST